MADENDRASEYEEHERAIATKHHAALMASIKPAEECALCGIELQEHRKQWGKCIHCAEREELRMRGFAR